MWICLSNLKKTCWGIKRDTDGDELDTITASVYIKCNTVYRFFATLIPVLFIFLYKSIQFLAISICKSGLGCRGRKCQLGNPVSSPQVAAPGEHPVDTGLNWVCPECLLDDWAHHVYKDDPGLYLKDICFILLLWSSPTDYDQNGGSQKEKIESFAL